MAKKSKQVKVSFWKFVEHPVQTTYEMAEALAKKIENGEFTPRNEYGERFYKSGGWCFDVGRKPYLIEQNESIYRKWASSVKELRESLYLSRSAKVVKDPFYSAEGYEH